MHYQAKWSLGGDWLRTFINKHRLASSCLDNKSLNVSYWCPQQNYLHRCMNWFLQVACIKSQGLCIISCSVLQVNTAIWHLATAGVLILKHGCLFSHQIITMIILVELLVLSIFFQGGGGEIMIKMFSVSFFGLCSALANFFVVKFVFAHQFWLKFCHFSCFENQNSGCDIIVCHTVLTIVHVKLTENWKWLY